jgi:hypothetical protein
VGIVADRQTAAAALVDTMQELFTREMDHLDGLTPTLVRHLGGDRCGDLLGLSPADKTRVIIGAVRRDGRCFA